jgi:hypothetical protein
MIVVAFAVWSLECGDQSNDVSRNGQVDGGPTYLSLSCGTDADCPHGFGCFVFEDCSGEKGYPHCMRRCDFDFDCPRGRLCVCPDRRRCSIPVDFYTMRLGFCR